jgi:hypothetical protein
MQARKLMRVESSAGGEPELTEDQLNLAVSKLCQITRESMLDYSIRVGSLVIHYFYGGDVKAWRSRGPKTHSFRRLAKHPQLPMSASSLYRCVAIFELCDRLNVVSRWSRITVSHLRVVLPFDEKEQCRLMSAANAERWSVQRLEQEARKVSSSGARRGRPAAPELVRFGRSVEKLHRSSSLVLESLPTVSGMLGEKYSSIARNIEQSIQSLKSACEAIGSLKAQADALSDVSLEDLTPVEADEDGDEDGEEGGGRDFEAEAIHCLDRTSAED